MILPIGRPVWEKSSRSVPMKVLKSLAENDHPIDAQLSMPDEMKAWAFLTCDPTTWARPGKLVLFNAK
jgi:hypothetical protein